MLITLVKLTAYSHSTADLPKKLKCKNTLKKESSPTTHLTEISFRHVLDPPDHFGTTYIFDHFFTYIHNLDLFFQQIFSKRLRVKSLQLESRVSTYSHSAADSPKKVSPKTPSKSPADNPCHRNQFSPRL